MDLGNLVDSAKDLPPIGALFILCLVALAVVWKALNVVSKAISSRRGES